MMNMISLKLDVEAFKKENEEDALNMGSLKKVLLAINLLSFDQLKIRRTRWKVKL